jgi:DNA-binding PadR family transcriptional regulator
METDMFGMRHSYGCAPGGWGARRGWRGHFGERWGGRHGMGGNMMRAGRMLAQGDLRLIALALIKVLEEKTSGWYSPSPGIVYPTLTYLEEAGYVTAAAEGTKKLYTITEEGRAYLDANRDFVDAVLERLAAIGEKVARMRRRFGEDDDRRGVPPLVRAALENLREVAAKRLDVDAEAEARVVEGLARAAAELKKR